MHSISRSARPAAPRRHTLRALLSAIAFRLVARAELRRQRRDLADLDDHILRDIGLSRDEARREARRPVWDAPSHWLR